MCIFIHVRGKILAVPKVKCAEYGQFLKLGTCRRLAVPKVRCRIWEVPVRIWVVPIVRCRIWEGACARREKVSASPRSAFVST